MASARKRDDARVRRRNHFAMSLAGTQVHVRTGRRVLLTLVQVLYTAADDARIGVARRARSARARATVLHTYIDYRCSTVAAALSLRCLLDERCWIDTQLI